MLSHMLLFQMEISQPIQELHTETTHQDHLLAQSIKTEMALQEASELTAGLTIFQVLTELV